MSSRSPSSCRVLVATADLETGGRIADAIRQMGHVPEGPVGDGLAVLSHAQEHEPDVVLIREPLTGEPQLSTVVHRLWHEAATPVILVSDGEADLKLERVQAVRPFCCLGSPPEPSELRLALEAAWCASQELGEMRRKLDQLRLSDQILKHIGNLVLVADGSGGIVYASPSITTLLGFTPDEVMGDGWWKVTRRQEKDRLAEKRYLSSAASGKALVNPDQYERRVFDKEGNEHWILWRDTQGPDRTVIGIGTDITERKQLTDALNAAVERYALAVKGAQDGLWDWEIDADKVYYSPRWREIVGEEATARENTIDDWFQRVHPADLERLQLAIGAHVEGSAHHFECEHRILHRDGSYRWVLARGLMFRRSRMVGSLTDITERELRDPLTGLPNRNLFLDRVRHSMARSLRRPDTCFAVLLLDIDRFKLLNESLGYEAGDEALKKIAERLQGLLRSSDSISRLGFTVARLGGDEFTILLEDLRNPSDGIRAADRILDHLLTPLPVAGDQVYLTASIGIAPGPAKYETIDDMMRDAEIAMHRAKAAGGARYELFDPQMHHAAVSRWTMEKNFRRALEQERLHLAFQPIVSLADGSLAGFEALARWHHDGAPVMPTQFIPIAEETGLIVPFGIWVLTEACRQALSWSCDSEAARLFVSVNLSARQVNPTLIQTVESVLRDTGLPPTNLHFELTESILLGHEEEAIEVLEALKNLGVRLAIDDFGTGYSSLSYLHRFPVDSLKIDRAFTHMLASGLRPRIVESILALASSLDLNVIAEGVETEEQAHELRSMGCELGQGYLFSHPLPADGTQTWISRRGSI